LPFRFELQGSQAIQKSVSSYKDHVMTTTAIRERLHRLIDTVEDKKAAAIYTLLEDSMKDVDEEYTDEFKAELDRRYAEHKRDGKVITREVMNKRIGKILSKQK
jgi:hypothetical protein